MIDVTPKSVMEYADVVSKVQRNMPATAASISAYRKNKDQADDLLHRYEEEEIETLIESNDVWNTCKAYLDDYVEYKRYYRTVQNVEVGFGLLGVAVTIGAIGKGAYKIVKFFKS